MRTILRVAAVAVALTATIPSAATAASAAAGGPDSSAVAGVAHPALNPQPLPPVWAYPPPAGRR